MKSDPQYDLKMPNIFRFLHPTGLLALAIASLFATVASGMSMCVLKSSKSCTGKIRGYKQVDYNQIFKYPQMTGTDSQSYSPPRYSRPTFYDLNGDGNDDLIAGAAFINKFQYFTTSLDGTFVQQNGSNNNPFDFIVPPEHDPAESTHLHAAFFDVDGDGDGDLAYVVYYAPTRFFENVGTATVPTFEERFNTNNPLIGIAGLPDSGTRSLAFVDLDGDGDEDYIIGCGHLIYYSENTGNKTSAAFTYRTGNADPFHLIYIEEREFMFFGKLSYC